MKTLVCAWIGSLMIGLCLARPAWAWSRLETALMYGLASKMAERSEPKQASASVAKLEAKPEGASKPIPRIRPSVTAAFEFGGEKLADLVYKDGSHSNIEAGRGLLIGAGGVVDISQTVPHTFEVQATMNVKWTSTKASSNGDVDWLRFPLEVLSFYRNSEKNVRLGGGFTYQFGNQMKGSGVAGPATADFKNALGYIAQADYFFDSERHANVTLRYTRIQYQLPGRATVDGDSFGIGIGYAWL